MIHQLSKEAWQGFLKSLGVIAASEIGDKTFFIAAIMAMRNPRSTVFSGAICALAAMTVLSVLLGWAAPTLIPKIYTHYAATLLFFFFGFRTLYEVIKGGGHDSEESELEQVEHELAQQNLNKSRPTLAGEDGKVVRSGVQDVLSLIFTPIFLKAFSLTFLAEWGDRSQIATIGLAASEHAVGVTVGSILGHAACTAAAVVGGRHLAEHINERAVHLFGGTMFVLFGLHALWQGPGES